MKKLAIVAVGAAAAMMLPGSVFAQASGTITASAAISSAMTVESSNPLNFGSVAPGATATVGINDAPAAGGNAGSGFVEFRTNSNYAVAVTLPANGLTNATADDDLPVVWACGASGSTASGGAAAFACDAGTTGTATGQTTVVVWLGGEVTVPATAMATTYTGDVTVLMSAN